MAQLFHLQTGQDNNRHMAQTYKMRDDDRNKVWCTITSHKIQTGVQYTVHTILHLEQSWPVITHRQEMTGSWQNTVNMVKKETTGMHVNSFFFFSGKEQTILPA